MKHRARKPRRGVTLVEAMIALTCLAVGIAGVSGILGSVAAANKRAAFHNTALDMFAAFAAQVADAQCDYYQSAGGANNLKIDPGLSGERLVFQPAAGSAITLVGQFGQTVNNSFGAPISPLLVPTTPVFLSYKVTHSPSDSPADGLTPPHATLLVQICDSNNEAMNPCPVFNGHGWWIREFSLNKSCTYRLDNDGRGEFNSP
jgi:hypothetical protein